MIVCMAFVVATCEICQVKLTRNTPKVERRCSKYRCVVWLLQLGNVTV